MYITTWTMIVVVTLCVIRVTLTEENTVVEGRRCVDLFGHPQMCYPPFQNFASSGRTVTSTNTCGLKRKQKYCIGLSAAQIRSRCAYCYEKVAAESHSANFLTDQNPNNWWQSETLAHNKNIHFKESINLTLDLGKQFHVTFIHLQFKSPRPRAMVIYKKYNDDEPWEEWQYFSSNCQAYFNIPNRKDHIIQKPNEVVCTEEFSSLSDFYNGIVMFATIYGRPGSENFFANKDIMRWATASQIKIELKKMHTFGDQDAEEELLYTYFYAIKSLQVAGRCWCNGHGNECRRSTGEGLEPKLYCVCHPAHHTRGQSCEICENFYQDIPWQPATIENPHICKKCECNGNSDSCIFSEELYIKSGNTSGGMCLHCKGNTKGPHCDECIEGFHKDPNQPNKCVPCNCDPLGRASIQCDSNGKCTCQPGIEGDKCTRCRGDHFNFGPRGCQPCNCNPAGVNVTGRLQCNPATGFCYCKKNVNGENCDKCIGGFFSLSEDDPLGCRPCFCFAHTKECNMDDRFVLDKIESSFIDSDDGWAYGNGTADPQFSTMLDVTTTPPSITWFNGREQWNNNYFLWAPVKFLGNKLMSYNLILELILSFGLRPGYKAVSQKLISMTNDVQLISDSLSVSVPFDVNGNPFPEADAPPKVYSFRLNEESGYWRDMVDSYRFNSILSNLTAIKIRLTNPYGFVRLHRATLNTAIPNVSLTSSLSKATSVEKCLCPAPYVGLSCDKCAPGYYRESPQGTEFVKCIKCSCNNQTDTCDIKTGKCHCKYNAVGHNCEKCAVGFYGDPTSQIPNVCRNCGCPGGTGCELVKTVDGNKVVCIDCPDNLGGYRCDRCRDNYFGDPQKGIKCEPCNCNGNIDYFSSCNHTTGKCSQCLYNSDGDYCEKCKSGYYLLPNEYAPNRCKRCVCDPYGSVDSGLICNSDNGNCFCKKLIEGQKCDTCKAGYFNLTADQACQPCKCFPFGSRNVSCHQQTGQCICKPGVTGRYCDSCLFGYYNLSDDGCQPCQCDTIGSTSLQCHQKTGICPCKPNIIGDKCDTCKMNFHNLTAGCLACPACYNLIMERVEELKKVFRGLLSLGNGTDGSGTISGRSSNVSKVIDLAFRYNETVYKLLDSVKNEYGIAGLENNMKSTNNTVGQLENNMALLRQEDIKNKMNDRIANITATEKEIYRLLQTEFSIKLQRLNEYVKYNSTGNANMTETARKAEELLERMITRKDATEKIVLESETLLNNSLNSFIQIIVNYTKFMNDSQDFDFVFLKKLSSSMATDSLMNLGKISSYDKTEANLKSQIVLLKANLSNLKMEDQDLRNTFNSIEHSIKISMTSFQGLLDRYNSITGVHCNIICKTKNAVAITNNFTELYNLMSQLENVENEINKAISNAKKMLNQLDEIINRFDEYVNTTKSEAISMLTKMPKLKKELDDIEKENNGLRRSWTNLLIQMNQTHNLINRSLENTNELQSNTKRLEEKFTLLNSTLNEYTKLSDLIIQNAEVKGRKNTHVLLELESLKTEVVDVMGNYAKQMKSTNSIDEKISNILKILKDLEHSANTVEDNELKAFDKEINSLKKKTDSILSKSREKTFLDILQLEKEYKEISDEMSEVDEEIKRLELIDSFMLGDGRTHCHKSGAKVEG